MRKIGRGSLALLLMAACVGAARSQPARAWRAPADASITGCLEGKAQAALMDDGSLLVACVARLPNSQYNNASVWRRAKNGAWSIAARPPTPTSRATTLRKLSGSAAVVTWWDYPPGPIQPLTRLQVWDAAAGAAAPFLIPGPADQPAAMAIPESWGSDGRAARLRRARAAEVAPAPGGPPWSIAGVIELVDKMGQPVGPALVMPDRAVIGDPSACVFPNGDRLVAFTSFQISGLPGSAAEIDAFAAIHRNGGGWEGPSALFHSSGVLPQATRALCAADGVARVIGAFGAPATFPYADLAGPDGWRPALRLNYEARAADDLSAVGDVQYARSGDGRAAIAWNDRQSTPAGVTGQPGHISIPRVQWIRPGDRFFSTDFAMPKYDPDAPEATAVNATAWDPKRERFVFVITGGPGPTPRRALAELSPTGGWSPAAALPGEFLDGWQLDFNAGGDGVLLGRRHGQLLISDWR